MQRPETPTDTSAETGPGAPGFVGREWLLSRVDQWLADPHGPPFFLLTGELGIGKTSFAARLKEVRPVAAAHFCVARRALTVDPLDFARSISHQLTRLTGFAESLLQEKNIRLEVKQHADTNQGQMIAVLIERLVVNAPSPVEAFNRAVSSPLQGMDDKGIDQTILIVVDGLDEALVHVGQRTIVDLLANAGPWPSQVRILLTSNPEDRVIRHFEAGRAHTETVAADQIENMHDLRAFISRQIESLPALQARLAEQRIDSHDYAGRVADACHGNFLYLVWLLADLASGPKDLDALNTLPAGLDGIYREFLRTRHIGQDSNVWIKRDRPVLGMLAAAQEPLPATTLAQLTGLEMQMLDDALRELSQCLAPPQSGLGRFELYHQSLAEFLGDRERAEEFWIDLPSVHRRVCERYLAKQDINWAAMDDYALRHLPNHLYLADRTDVLELLLLDYPWIRARLGAAGVSRLIADYDLVAASEATRPVQQALRLAAHVLAGDRSQLSTQLVGRLPTAPGPLLGLRQAAERQADVPWLRPITASLVAAGGPMVRTLAGHSDSVHAVILLHGGDRLASACYDGSIRVWDLTTGQALQALGGPKPLRFESKGWPALAALANGRFVSNTRDGSLVVWDADSGAEVRRFGEHPRGIWALAALPDGRRVLTGSRDGSITLWDAETGTRLRNFGPGHTNTIHGFGMSLNGGQVVSGSEDKRLLLWDVETGTLQAELLHGHTEGVLSVITVPGHNQVVSASRDGTARVWDIDKRRGVQSIIVSPDSAIPAIAALPDGRRLVSATWNGRLDLWDLATGQHISMITAETGRCWSLAALSDGRRVVSAHEDGSIKVWDVEESADQTQPEPWLTDKTTKRAGHARPVYLVRALPDNRRAVSVASDKTLKVWDIGTGQEMLSFTVGEAQGLPAVTALQVVSDSKVLVGMRDGQMMLIELAAGHKPYAWQAHELSSSRQGLTVWAVAVLPRNQGFISASELGQVCVWDRGGNQRHRFTVGAWGDRLNHMVMDLFPLPDGRRVLAVSYSGQVYYQHRLRLWDLETGAAIWTLPNPMKLMAVRPDVAQVLGIMDGAWRLWDVQTGTEVERVPAPAGWIDSAYWLPNLEQTIGITADGELRLWAIKTGVVLAGFGADAAIQSCALTADGAVVVAGDSGGNLHFLRLVEQSGSESLRPAAWWQFWKKGPGESRAK